MAFDIQAEYARFSKSESRGKGLKYFKIAARTNPLVDDSTTNVSVTRSPWNDGQKLSLCDVCQSIDTDELLGFDFDIANWDGVSPEGKVKDHHKSYADLVLAATGGCQLCRAIWVGDTSGWAHIKSTYQLAEDRGLDYGLDSTQIKFQSTPGDSASRHSKFSFFQSGGDRFRHLRTEFEVFAYDDDNAAKLVAGRPIVNNPWADVRFRLARYWIKDCEQNHTCGTDEIPNLPTRVLDVGDMHNARDPFLCSGQGKRGKWVALSHCWGGSPDFKLTLSTIKEFEQRIPFSKLDLTFQHAITITRLTGYRYIWIDCFCIIQKRYDGDEAAQKDWEKEAPKMGHIYGKAALTLVADCTASSTDGMVFKSSSDEFLPVARLPLASRRYGTTGEVFLRYPLFLRSRLRQTTMRAWILQEDQLSVRKLHFGIQQMFWSCRQCKRSEGYRDQSALSVTSVPSDLGLIGMRDPDDGWQLQLHMVQNLKPAQCLEYWYNLLDDFVQRKLSHESDRLSAISSLARSIANQANLQYVAGLWKEHIHFGLMWSVLTSGKRLDKKEYKGVEPPSWTWASLLHEPPVNKFTHRLYGEIGLRDAIPEQKAHILNYHINTTTTDSFGPVESGGYMDIQSWWIPCSKLQEVDFPQPFWSNDDTADFIHLNYHGIAPSGQIICHTDLPIEDIYAYCPIPDLCFLQVATYSQSLFPKETHFLLLKPLDESFQKYRRVGVAYSNHDDTTAKMAAHLQLKTVRIY